MSGIQTRSQPPARVTTRQLETLVQFLEANKDLAVGYVSSGLRGRAAAKVSWGHIAGNLNMIPGPQKPAKAWGTFWSNFKNKLKTKLKKLRRAAKGDGTPCRIQLTDMELRVQRLLGAEFCGPVSEGRVPVVVGQRTKEKKVKLQRQPEKDEELDPKLDEMIIDLDSQNRSQPPVRVTARQLETLVKFLEANKDLAVGYVSSGLRGRAVAHVGWGHIAETLNTIPGPQKPAKAWGTFWSNFKNKLKTKVKKLRRAAEGDGPHCRIRLTDMELRVQRLLGDEFCGPVSEGRVPVVVGKRTKEKKVKFPRQPEKDQELDPKLDEMIIDLDSFYHNGSAPSDEGSSFSTFEASPNTFSASSVPSNKLAATELPPVVTEKSPIGVLPQESSGKSPASFERPLLAFEKTSDSEASLAASSSIFSQKSKQYAIVLENGHETEDVALETTEQTIINLERQRVDNDAALAKAMLQVAHNMEKLIASNDAHSIRVYNQIERLMTSRDEQFALLANQQQAQLALLSSLAEYICNGLQQTVCCSALPDDNV